MRALLRLLRPVEAEALHLSEDLADPLDQVQGERLLLVGVAEKKDRGQGFAGDPPRRKGGEHLLDERRDPADLPLAEPDRRKVETGQGGPGAGSGIRDSSVAIPAWVRFSATSRGRRPGAKGLGLPTP